jgi:hypothetical protein
MQLTHSLKGAWFQPFMNLKCDILVSKFAFKWVNLCRYSAEVWAKDFMRTAMGFSVYAVGL